MVSTNENIHTTPAAQVCRMVRDQIMADARKDIRQRIDAACGKWSDWAGIVRDAMIAFLESDGPRQVIVYHATPAHSPAILARSPERRHEHGYAPSRAGNRPRHGVSSVDPGA